MKTFNLKSKSNTVGSRMSIAEMETYANIYLSRKYGITWDDLPDSVTIADLSGYDKQEIRDACERRWELSFWYY